MKDISDLRKQIEGRRVPISLVYLSPFRIVEGDESDWLTSIEEINSKTWNYVTLHEIASGADVGLEQPYHLVIGRDGALCLPIKQGLRSNEDVCEFFNHCLAGLLLGGIYCESVNPDNLEIGSIIDWKYIRSYGSGSGASNTFHHATRMRACGPLEAIELLDPRRVGAHEIRNKIENGISILEKTQKLSGHILLKGVTSLARRDWVVALSNLWIVNEQILNAIWERDILPDSKGSRVGGARRDQLKDVRTWNTANRIELLYQTSVISEDTLARFFVARKARNDLSHRGVSPSEQACRDAYSCFQDLLRAWLPETHIGLFDLDLSDHTISDPFKPRSGPFNPQFFMPIPKLPGEEDLEKKEAELRRLKYSE